MIKNALTRFSLLGAMLVFLLSACSTPRYSHAKHQKTKKERTARYASNTKSSKRTKTKRSRSARSSKKVAAVKSLDLRLSIIKSAERFLGTKYVYGGKTPSPGFDCSGFTSYVFQENGVPVKGASHHQSKMGKKIPKEKAAPGDLVFFGKGSKVSHVAIVKANTGNKLEVIHSTSSSGVKVDDINSSDYWKKRYLYTREVIH